MDSFKFYLGVTNNNWYKFLSKNTPEEVNFWRPGGNAVFKVLKPGEPFLFKLKGALNAIGGIGFFVRFSTLPLSLAWDIFGEKNGCRTFGEFQKLILSHRTDKENINPAIGCIILTNPIFFESRDWIETPQDWSNNIVQGKSYSTLENIGKHIWDKIEMLMPKYLIYSQLEGNRSQIVLEGSWPGYGQTILQKVRLGQGAFRLMVTESYNKRCSITGEKTLPVLEAAHIKPYAESGPHFISNGILLRSDMHKLFDSGYITITSDNSVEVSKRIKEEFENGREYYQYHGKQLLYLPENFRDRPGKDYINWHNENIYRG